MAVATVISALGCRPALSPSPTMGPTLQPGAVSSTAALTPRQRRWVDSTLASLDLHDKV